MVVGDEEDILRDPESSDDEKVPPRPVFANASIVDGAQDEQPKTAQFKSLQPQDLSTHPEQGRTAWKQTTRPQLRSPESTRSKRSNESEEQEQGSSDIDNQLWSSQGSSKRVKTASGITGNIHGAKRKIKTQYGRKASAARSSGQSVFKERTKAEKVEEPKRPKFELAKGVDDMHRFQGNQSAQAEFKTPDQNVQAGARDSLSPSLSSFSSVPDSPDVEEIAKFNLPAPAPYCATATCDICGASVDKLMKENFQDQYTKGKQMSFRWQQRFCRHHKQQTAKEEWQRRGWPDIDWAGLEQRMYRFDDRLRDVICNPAQSEWKQDLRRQKRPSKSKLPEVGAAGDEPEIETRAWTGYYGPRGEKVMTEHIVSCLSDDIRQRASKDKIVAASGVKGGVSGFVHDVLVPELACCLIAEDLGVTADEARATVELSADTGVLLHPDVDEDVTGRGEEEDLSDEMEV